MRLRSINLIISWLRFRRTEEAALFIFVDYSRTKQMQFHYCCCTDGQVRKSTCRRERQNDLIVKVSGSFLEFLPILALLKQKYTLESLPYHVVVPSLPGYGFSSRPPLDRDFTLLEASQLLHSLMQELGFGSGYIAQGGDVGSKLARILATNYEGCKGLSTHHTSTHHLY